MKLLVSELKGTLFQMVSPKKNTQVEAVRVHLYKHRSPTGTVTLEIHDLKGKVIASSSEVLSSEDVSSSSFFHGQTRFYIKAHLRKNKTYRIVLKGTGGYAFSESAYFGWCSSFDLSAYPATYEVDSTFEYPLSLEIWSKD